ncbi:cyclase family protein [Rhodopirellula sp. JC740]|uniref:Cyclase family protein n=1 Tax=Rhodopirellula halodulae TaxID=2894198 RepID=A0ABS8NNB3_9BACT|nr:cyclase family protein [Rhodopirellula sp. JC740]MCC9645055.1 cyclase family protein [Rhodopirellula sp. JC740]
MKVVDLTLTLEPGMRGVEFESKFTLANDGWNASTLHLYSHCGTHMDAPLHFEAAPQTIDQIPIEDCLGPAWVVDLTHLEPKTPIEVHHLQTVADQHRPGDALLFKTGWSRHVHDAAYYRDNFQPISPELATWMVEHKVRLIGVEPPSVADVNDLPAVTLVHKILLGGNVIIVEGLTNLDAITTPKCLFGAMPLKVAGGDGAPCRAFAILDVPIDQ